MERIEQIKQALRELVELVTSRGEPLTDEIRAILTQAMEHTATRISEIRQEQAAPPEQPPQSPAQGLQEAPPSADAQLLWILAGQQEGPFVQYLHNFPTPATSALLNNPDQLESTINFLRQMMPHGEQPRINGITHSDLNSSNIWGTAYNPSTGQMKVRFQGGAEYEYDGVPQNIYQAFAGGHASAKTNGQNQYGAWWEGKNPSLGAALNQYIKAAGFPYRRIV
jgi:hypothetical protein